MFRLKEVGQVAPVPSCKINSSKFGLGFEKLDRDAFDPDGAYDYVAKSGAKWIRIQSGWAKTETVKGVYDFAWLDKVVDKLISIGCTPWICLCYGNGLYNKNAATVFGAVGCPPIYTPEERLAWAKYVAALTDHYKGRVNHFEIWNEPDGAWCWKKFNDDGTFSPVAGSYADKECGREYGEFAISTIKAIHEGNKDAKAIIGSMCGRAIWWLEDVLRTGCAKDAWGFTYHCYSADERDNPAQVAFLRSLLKKYNADIKVIQGESGSQSRPDGAGALRGMAWTEKKQAKQLLRHSLSDLILDVEFLSYFSCMDMYEALSGKVGDKASYKDFGYFGLLGAEFNDEGQATGIYRPKLSYFAYQNISSIFRDDCKVSEIPFFIDSETSQLMGWKPTVMAKELTTGCFEKSNGAKVFVYWKPTDIITQSTYETVSITFGEIDYPPRLVDPMTGKIYELPESICEKKTEGCYILHNLPLFDYPLILEWGFV